LNSKLNLKEINTDFESEVTKIVEEYGAPEDITNEIVEFLINSGNIYTIIEIAKEMDI
jgi:hypothetical protein